MSHPPPAAAQNFTRTKLSPTREPPLGTINCGAINCGPISKATCPASILRLIEFALTGASIIDHTQKPNIPTNPAVRREQSPEESHSPAPGKAVQPLQQPLDDLRQGDLLHFTASLVNEVRRRFLSQDPQDLELS